MDNLVHLRITQKQLIKVVLIFFLMNLWVLMATFIIYNYKLPNDTPARRFLNYFDLVYENNFGTCYSAWLLLAVAIVAALCFLADRQYQKEAGGSFFSYGWLFFTLIFGLLSLDEIGSFHERMGDEDTFHLFGEQIDWFLFRALIYVVAFYIVIFCWQRFRQNLWSGVLMVLGLLFFLSLHIQEKYEIALNFKRPVELILLEEGSEIFGSFCFLSAMVLALVNLAKKNSGKCDAVEIKVGVSQKSVLAGMLALLVLLTFGQVFIYFYFKNFAKADKGIPENWFPGAAAFLAAAITLILYYNKTGSTVAKPKAYLFTGFFCLIISFVYGGNFYSSFLHNHSGGLSLLIKVFLMAGILGVGIALIKTMADFWTRVGVIFWMLLLGLTIPVRSIYTAEVGFVAFAALLLGLVSLIYEGQKDAARPNPSINAKFYPRMN